MGSDMPYSIVNEPTLYKNINSDEEEMLCEVYDIDTIALHNKWSDGTALFINSFKSKIFLLHIN